jgi:hypothetical protein
MFYALLACKNFTSHRTSIGGRNFHASNIQHIDFTSFQATLCAMIGAEIKMYLTSMKDKN